MAVREGGRTTSVVTDRGDVEIITLYPGDPGYDNLPPNPAEIDRATEEDAAPRRATRRAKDDEKAEKK